MEFSILNTLSFDITFPTAFRFLERYVKQISEDQTIMMYACFLVELALVDIRML